MENDGGWDEVESLVSLSDATIYSQNDAVSIADSQDIDNELGVAMVQDNGRIVQEDSEEFDEEDELENLEPTPHEQKSTKDVGREYEESEISELKDSNNEVKTTVNRDISDKLDPISDKEGNLQTNVMDTPGENSSDEEENPESEEMLDGGTEELPFVRSVKYLEKHEIFRLFQNLAADIVYQRPDNPLQFIVDKLEKEKQESQRTSSEDTTSNQDSHPS